MKTILTLSTVLFLSFVSPVLAGNDPTPMNKKDHREMMTKKKKHKNKKNKLFKRNKRNHRNDIACNAPG